jgi:hypothetical protein
MGGCLIEPADSLVQPVIPDQSRARADLKQTKQSAPLSIQHWLENRRCGGVWSEPTEVSGGSETGGLIRCNLCVIKPEWGYFSAAARQIEQ